MFLGTLAAAAPALTGARVAQAQPALAAGRGEADAVFDQIRLQLITTQHRARSRGAVSSEDAAVCAAMLRVAAVHARELGIDRTAAAALQAVIARHGTGALAAAPREAVFAALARRGVDVPARLRAAPAPADATAPGAVVEMILAGRSSAAVDQLAAAFDRAAPRLAPRVSAPVPQAAQWDSTMCPVLIALMSLYWYYALAYGSMLDDHPEYWPYFENLWAAYLMADQIYWETCFI